MTCVMFFVVFSFQNTQTKMNVSDFEGHPTSAHLEPGLKVKQMHRPVEFHQSLWIPDGT